MIKLSSIFKWSLFIAVFVLGEYVYIIAPSFFQGHGTLILFLVGILGVLQSIIVIFAIQHQKIKVTRYNVALKYLQMYTIILLFMISYTAIKYNYTLKHAIAAITPYLYIYYSLPLIYLYDHDKTPLSTLKKVSIAVILMLCIKVVCWFLFNYKGIVIFKTLIFRFSEAWVRNGLLRMDPGCLFGVTFSVVLSYCCIHKRNYKYKIISALMLCFVVFITQFRFQIMSIIVLMVVGIYISSNNKTTKRNKLIVGIIAVLLFVGTDGFDMLLSSFSVSGSKGDSTIARLRTISHYWSLMKDQKAIFGLGLLNNANPLCYDMMKYITPWGRQTWYFLEDIGILGGFFRLGIFAIPVYGVMFIYGIRAYKICRQHRKRELYVLVSCIVSYLIFSNMALNIFDGQRAFAVPFYLSIISYSYGTCCDDTADTYI